MALVTGKVGSVYIIDNSTSFAAEDASEDGSTGIYEIDDSLLIPWNPAVPIVLSSGSFDLNYYDKGVNWFEGKVKVTSGIANLTLTGENVDFQQVGYISSWSLTLTADVGETTAIGDTWKTNSALGKSATVSLNRYRFDTLFDLTDGEDVILLKLYETGEEGDGTGFWITAIRNSFGYNKAINAIDTETISFAVTGNVLPFEES
jgi:hypothetical protein